MLEDNVEDQIDGQNGKREGTAKIRRGKGHIKHFSQLDRTDFGQRVSAVRRHRSKKRVCEGNEKKNNAAN